MASRASRGIWSNAYLLLAATALMWGANGVAGRLAVGEVSPMALTTARWTVSCAVLALYARRDIARDVPRLRTRWAYVLWMGGLGFTAFNALYYEAAHLTTAINITILQGSMPVLVLIGSLLVYKTRITPVQVVGMVVTLAGMVVLATQGDPERLRTMSFNVGDIWMLIACVFYSAYIVGLRSRPSVAPLAFFSAMAGVAALTSLPLLALEAAAGRLFWPTAAGWAIIGFVGLFPSLLGQLIFIRGVELIGPSRAGLFMNLVPVFGTLLAVLILHEPFGTSSALALALVLVGIFIAEQVGKR